MSSSLPICPYCGLSMEPGSSHLEHPIARAFGSPLVVPAHTSCGETLNRDVDGPLVQCFPCVKVRADYRIPDRNGNVPDAPRLVGTNEAGERSSLAWMPMGRMAVRHFPHERVADDGVVTVRFDYDEDPKVIEKKLAAVRGRHDKVRAVRERGGRQRYTLGPIRVPAHAWMRTAAKVGLAIGSRVADPEWIRSDTAAHLREVLWSSPGDETYLALDMAPGDLPENSAVRGALLPPEHFFWTSHTRQGLASVCFCLFAEWFMPVPLALTPEEGELVRDYAWLVNPYRAKVMREGPLDEIAALLDRRRPRVQARLRAFDEVHARVEREVAARRGR